MMIWWIVNWGFRRFRKFSFRLAFLGVYLVWGMNDGRLNNIAVEFHLVNVAKGEHRKPEFKGRCSFKSREVQAGAVIWCYHVGEMCNSLWVWKQLGVCAHGWDLSVCCSHQPIRKNPLYCWWVVQAGWKVRRILTLLFHTKAILRFLNSAFICGCSWGYHCALVRNWRNWVPCSSRDVLGDKAPSKHFGYYSHWIWPVGGCSKFIYFLVCCSHAIMEYLACTRPGVADHW